MIMKIVDQGTYPNFTRYMKKSMPTVATNKFIVAAFKKYGQIDGTTLKRALKWGELPNINIALDPDNYGTFNGDVDPDTINLDSDTVKTFEDGGGYVKNKWGLNVPLIGAKFLHELIHWADFRDGIDFPGEEGEQFETDVYGKVLQA